MKSFIAIIVTMFASQVFAADAPKAEAKKDAPKAEAKKEEAKKDAAKKQFKHIPVSTVGSADRQDQNKVRIQTGIMILLYEVK